MSYPENILKIFGHPQEILENILWPWRNTRKYCNFFFFSKMYILDNNDWVHVLLLDMIWLLQQLSFLDHPSTKYEI